jgi:D-alanyl-D-alanine carboxypeptidase
MSAIYESSRRDLSYEDALYTEPEREYRVSPRHLKRKRRLRLLPLLLVGAMLFGCGFLLGKASAVQMDAETLGAVSSAEATSSPEAETAITPIKPVISDGQTATEWNLVLINGDNPLSEDFTAPELTQLRNNQSIDSRVYPALQEMMDAARAAGYQPLICSSFRTWDKQEQLFQKKVQSYLDQGYAQAEAEEQAAFWVARPGTSEHQAGLAVDIVDTNYQILDEQQEKTAVQQWLMAHCAEYGFILRYPTDKNNITGVGYEPWHYRYVGVEAAKEIMEQGLCLEEYLAG